MFSERNVFLIPRAYIQRLLAHAPRTKIRHPARLVVYLRKWGGIHNIYYIYSAVTCIIIVSPYIVRGTARIIRNKILRSYTLYYIRELFRVIVVVVVVVYARDKGLTNCS